MAEFNFRQDEDDKESSDDQNDSSPSVTNVRLNQRDHPEAYDYMKDKGPIRSFAKSTPLSTKEFTAEFVTPVGILCDEGDPIPLMQFARLEVDDILDFMKEEDMSLGAGNVLKHCDEHDLGTIESDDESGTVTITFNKQSGGDTDDTDDSDEE